MSHITRTKTVVQFKAPRHALLDALQKLTAVQAPKYGQLPLDHFHADVRKTGITLTRSNIDLQLSGKVSARGLVPGKMLLPPQAIPFLKASPAKDVVVSLLDHPEKYEDRAVDKNIFVVDVGPWGLSTFHKVYKTVTKTRHSYEVTVIAGATTSTLEGKDIEDFPPVAEVTGKTVRVTGLAKALGEVSYAVAREDHRPVLTGINLTLGKGRMELAAADGFRLAVTRIPARGKADPVIVPMPAAAGIQKHIKGPVVMRIQPQPDGKENQSQLVSFEGDGYTLVCRGILGTYPNHQQLIPSKGKHLKATTKPLIEAVKMAMTAGGVVALQSTPKGLKVMGKGGAANNNRVETTIKAVGKAQIAFNAHYLMDLLGRVGDNIDLVTTTSQSPAVVKLNSTTHVLMPISFPWEKPKPKVFNGVSEVKV